MPKLPFVSVILCSFNGAKKIKNTLIALKKQTYPNFEIIVVDDGSSDKTAQIAEDFGVITISHSQNKGLSASRNTGIKKSKGEIIAFTDDDCVPDLKWLQELVNAYSNSEIVGVGGKVVVANNDRSIITTYLRENNPLQPLLLSLTKSNSILYRFYLYIRKLFFPKIELKQQQVYMIVGANMSFRKKVFEQIGLFDETFHFGADEEDFCKRIFLQHIGELWYIPKAIIYHLFDINFFSFLKKSKLYGKGNARMYHKYPTQNPTIFPFPLFCILCILLCVWHWQFFILAVVSPVFLYANWLIKAIVKLQLSYLLFSYIQLGSELFNDVGFFEGWIAYKNIIKEKI